MGQFRRSAHLVDSVDKETAVEVAVREIGALNLHPPTACPPSSGTEQINSPKKRCWATKMNILILNTTTEKSKFKS